MSARFEVCSMTGHPEWIEPCAAWWHRQWGEHMGYSIDGARSAIDSLCAPGSGQAALAALVDGRPAGSVFLVDQDLDTHRHLTPWLAGLLVQPEFRQLGLGSKLAVALVEQSASLGYDTLYLYTTIPGFYERLGWTIREELVIHHQTHYVMANTGRSASEKTE